MLAWAELAMMFLRDLDEAFVDGGDGLEAAEGIQGRANEARG